MVCQYSLHDTMIVIVMCSYSLGILGQLLLSFSVYTNVPKILSTRQGTGTLTAVNGIRFISMTWVILGHTFAFGLLNGGIGMYR